jgi:hypothetical protein
MGGTSLALLHRLSLVHLNTLISKALILLSENTDMDEGKTVLRQ